jgi:hypothetical protein
LIDEENMRLKLQMRKQRIQEMGYASLSKGERKEKAALKNQPRIDKVFAVLEK